jgi:SAM-dependent methyltransferase
MHFSPEWDMAYRAGRQMGEWPWSDLVSLVYRHARPSEGYRRVLELGPGSGANIPLFLSLGVEYCAIEGSTFMVERLRARFSRIAANIVVGDFTQEIPFDRQFDLAVDRASITHNTTASVRRALLLIFGALRPGGKLIGVDWFSAAHSAAVLGLPLDSHTKRDVPGTFSGVGAVHFSDRDHLVDLLNETGFLIEYLAHKEVRVEIPSDYERVCVWNFVALKRG